MKKKSNLREWQMPNPKRDRKILELREKGLTFRQIAAKTGISAGRVFQIVKKKLSTV